MRRIIGILLTLLFLAVFTGFPVLGQDTAIQVKSKEVKSQFPEGVAFEVAAQTEAPARVQEIKLEMSVKGSLRGSYAYLEFAPDTSVQGKYLLRTGGAQYKPPGILIEYRFIITDSAGRTLETESENFLYLDNRFQWERLAEGPVEVYYYGSTKERAELVLRASVETVARMGKVLGVTSARPIRIIGYNNPRDMLGALPFQGKAAQQELLVQGQAHYEYGVLLVLSGDPQADGVTSHEVTHMVVRDAAKGAYANLPAWLNEGLAEYGNINPGYSYDQFLEEAKASNRLLPLRHLQNMPGLSREVLLAYGQARSVVKFMVDTYGEDKIKELMAALSVGLNIDQALKRVYGIDQDGLDRAWRQSLGLAVPEPAPVPVPAPPRSGGFGCAAPIAR